MLRRSRHLEHDRSRFSISRFEGPFLQRESRIVLQRRSDTSQKRWQERNAISLFYSFSPGWSVHNIEWTRHHAVTTCLTDIDISRQSRYDCQSDSPPTMPPRLPWIVAAGIIFICRSDFCAWKNNFRVKVPVRKSLFFLTRLKIHLKKSDSRTEPCFRRRWGSACAEENF